MDNELFESVHQYIPWLNCQRVRALILKQATGGGMLTTLLHTSRFALRSGAARTAAPAPSGCKLLSLSSTMSCLGDTEMKGV